MIVQSLMNFFCGFLDLILGGVSSFITIPADYASTIGTIASYGSWVVGADLMIIFSGCVLFWCGVKLTLGVALFIWRLLPLT